MPNFIVIVWETREFLVRVEAANEDDAKEIAEENYPELSTQDCFVSVETREVEIEYPENGK